MSQRNRKKQKVCVALSGGVDSSVAAALLKERGYAVTGIFIKVWQPPFLKCTWPKDHLDAMRVCAELEVPFKAYDFEAEYKRDVVEYMISEYKSGRTPNPDVMCNIRIKFAAFLKRALGEGADCIATGHYVRSEKDNDRHTPYTAADRGKDQSYFLWGLGQYELSRSLFPIGGYQKGAVRALAEKYRLPTARKRDSQGLCFLGKLHMRDFLAHFIEEREGDVLDERGFIIGTHRGAIFYTLGQRHGFTITSKVRMPHYIIGKDMRKNTITVSPDKSRAHVAKDSEEVVLSQTNWIGGQAPSIGSNYKARSRYRQALAPCVIRSISKDTAVLSFPVGKPLMPPGQSLVLYAHTKHDDKRELIGGGIIEA